MGVGVGAKISSLAVGEGSQHESYNFLSYGPHFMMETQLRNGLCKSF
jgi:hypothetical protein